MTDQHAADQEAAEQAATEIETAMFAAIHDDLGQTLAGRSVDRAHPHVVGLIAAALAQVRRETLDQFIALLDDAYESAEDTLGSKPYRAGEWQRVQDVLNALKRQVELRAQAGQP